MGKLWNAIKVWWENRKDVVVNFVIPKLDLAIQPMAEFIASRGVKKEVALKVATEAVSWLKTYFRRQL